MIWFLKTHFLELQARNVRAIAQELVIFLFENVRVARPYETYNGGSMGLDYAAVDGVVFPVCFQYRWDPRLIENLVRTIVPAIGIWLKL